MKLTISGDDYSDRVIADEQKVSASLSDTFGQLAKQKTYVLRDYDDFFNPFAPEGLFALINYRGLEVVETNDAGLVVFRGTIQNAQETDDRLCVISCQEPLALFLDWPVEASDTETYSGFRLSSAAAQGANQLSLQDGTGLIPAGAVVWFNDRKVPSYIATTTASSGGNTTQITLDRPLETALDSLSRVTVSVPVEIAGSLALKNAIQTAAPDLLLDGTFDIIADEDTDNDALLYVNVREQDQIKLRDYIRQICVMARLEFFQKPDGYYTCRRGLEYKGETISDELTGAELCAPVEISFDDSQLIIGYDLLYRKSATEAAILSADVDPALVEKYKGIAYWKPAPSAKAFAELKYLYASEDSARFFGEAQMKFYSEPLVVVRASVKKTYHDEPLRDLNLYVGMPVLLTVRNFVKRPAIITALEYDAAALRYSSVTFVLNGASYDRGAPDTENLVYLADENGDPLLQENLDFIEVE